jgi:imidazole glycerol-phosphate synthase subunit HisH
MKVGIIDYGVGNLGSVAKAIEALGVARLCPALVDRPADLQTQDCLILPGVGNFAGCSQLLEAGGWSDAIRGAVKSQGRPLLGICVGMQLLADSSEEGAISGQDWPGLGLVPGRVRHLRALGCTLRVPHVGWNDITAEANADRLLQGVPDHTDFYFVHSYAFVPEDPADIAAVTHYGIPVPAVVRRGTVWGTQFHPEKSSRAGFRVLRNFIEAQVC